MTLHGWDQQHALQASSNQMQSMVLVHEVEVNRLVEVGTTFGPSSSSQTPPPPLPMPEGAQAEQRMVQQAIGKGAIRRQAHPLPL